MERLERCLRRLRAAILGEPAPGLLDLVGFLAGGRQLGRAERRQSAARLPRVGFLGAPRRGGGGVEARIREDHAAALGLALDLEPEQIAAGGQVRERVALDEELLVVVDERRERDDVERAVRREQQLGRRAERGRELAHRQRVERVAELGDLRVRRIRDGLADLLDRVVDRRGGAEVDEHRIALARQHVGRVAAWRQDRGSRG